ncbi:hypothetical protein L7F22_051407 [Adiantum nelumboides]|nr:hypothetical protein [Adiantum nelumboides]
MALLVTLLASTQISIGGADEQLLGKDQREGRTEPAPSSYFKGWGDWAQGKIGYGKKAGETPSQHAQVPDSATAGGWGNWAFEKISSFSSRASKGAGEAAGKAAQAGKERLKAEKETAAKEGEEMLEGAQGGAKGGSEKVKDYAGKAKEGVQDKAAKKYEAGKEAGVDASQKIKDAEL